MIKLHVDSVIKSYDTRQVLTDVFISCQKGEIIGLLGRNGAGKSTLMKIIFGSIPSDTKFVRVGDKITDGLFDNRRLIKYLPQDGFLPGHIKARTIIDLFCDKERAEQMKSHGLIVPMLDKKSRHLSGGERRLLEILLVIYSDSAFTLVDEPFNGLAPVYREAIKELIRKQSVDKGFIITDHDYRNILDIATRVIIIHDGGTREIQSKEDLIEWGYIPETA